MILLPGCATGGRPIFPVAPVESAPMGIGLAEHVQEIGGSSPCKTTSAG